MDNSQRRVLLVSAAAAALAGVGYLLYRNASKPAKAVPQKPAATQSKPASSTASSTSASTSDVREKAQQLKADGNNEYKKKDYKKAVEAYTEALRILDKKDQDRAVLHCNRAACYLAMDMYENVIKDCTAALEIDNRYVKAFNRRAQAYEKMGERKKALYDYTAVCFVERFGRPQSMQELDRALKELGREIAERIMKTRSHHMPSRSTVQTFFDSFSSISLKEAATVSSLNAQIAADESNGELYYRRALALLHAKRYDESFDDVCKAADLLTNALKAASDADREAVQAKWVLALNLRGAFYHLRCQYDEAEASFVALLAQVPNHVDTMLKRGCSFMETGQIARATEEYERALKLEASNSDVYYHMGQRDFQTGNVEQAFANFSKAVEFAPKNYSPYVQHAVCLYKMGKPKEALDRFQSIEQKFSNVSDIFCYEAQLYLDLARIQLEQGQPDSENLFEKAVQLLDKSMEKDKQSAMPYFYKSLIYLNQRKVEKSMELLHEAINVDRQFEHSYQQLAQLYLEMGKLEEAISHYDKCLPLLRTIEEVTVICALREAALAQSHVLKTYPSMPVPNPM
eukprot:m.211844 g.211844  ORF g.211844 m.211844 type:complete len:573 (+) comp18998_c0_seq1:59-1777(+)